MTINIIELTRRDACISVGCMNYAMLGSNKCVDHMPRPTKLPAEMQGAKVFLDAQRSLVEARAE